MKYNYLKDDEVQYEYWDCDKQFAYAEYKKSFIEEYVGNPFIEALPRPRDKFEVYNAYTVPLNGFDKAKIKDMSQYEREVNIKRLRHIRFALPFQIHLEYEFNEALITSYANRKIKYINKKKVVFEGAEKNINSELRGDVNSAANCGFVLIGSSGTGKSSSLKILLNRYPQTIIHRHQDYGQFVQITYVSVVCPVNSNFNSLLSCIGAEIDRALDNNDRYYENLIRKSKGIGCKVDELCNLIELFGIGSIILDEIQNISFNTQKENSFDSLLTVVNRTKVAIISIGTEDAYKKMYPSLRTARRTGFLIDANEYCKNKKFINAVFNKLMQYQWLDEKLDFTEEVFETMFKLTGGIIDQIISLYICIQIEALRSFDKLDLRPKTIESIYRYNCRGQSKFIKIINKYKYDDELLINNGVGESCDELIEVSNDESIAKHEQIIKNVIDNVKNSININDLNTMYNDTTISNVARSILKTNEDYDEIELSKQTLKQLLKGKSDIRRTKKPKINFLEVKDELLK